MFYGKIKLMVDHPDGYDYLIFVGLYVQPQVFVMKVYVDRQ